MELIRVTTDFFKFNSIDELNEIEKKMYLKATEARIHAYAPYSNFLVGVSILLEDGQIITASNQENAAYPSGLCAERVGVFYVGANFPNLKIKKIFITAGPSIGRSNEPIPPCGACRQSLVEYEVKQQDNIEIYFMGTEGDIVKTSSLKNLLPFIFDKSSL